MEPLEPRLLFTAAAITSVSPLANSHTALVSTDAWATYDQNIDTGGSVTDTAFVVHAMLTGQIVNPPHGNTISVVGDTITFNPDNDFKPGETIQVIATDGILNTLAEPSQPRVWEFRTAVTGGEGEFTDSGQALGTHLSNGVSLGDVDGDTDLDAFVAGAFGHGNHVWLGDGSGSFTDSGQDLSNHNSLGVSMGDVDGDGDLDAFVTNSSGQGNRVWLNDGSGNFSDSAQILGDHNSYGVTLGDLNGDGDLDAFVANNNQGNRVWLGDGSGNFTDSGQNLANRSSRSVALGDVDGDGDLDGVTSNGMNQGNRVWRNDGSGNFSDTGQDLGNYDSVRVALGDLDGDGDLDAFVANFSFGDRVWLGDGSGNFSDSGQNLAGHGGYGVSLGDLDGDGDLDAFVANTSGQGNRVWLGDGSGNFSDSGPSLGHSTSRSVSIGDVDGDGDLDAFVANLAQPNLVWINGDLAPGDLDVQITTTESIDPVLAGSGGGNLTHIVTATNNGPMNATGLSVSELLTVPSGVSIDSFTPSAGNYNGGAAGTWTIGNLTNGASETLTIVFTVGPSALQGSDAITNESDVASLNELDVVASNDSSVETTSIIVDPSDLGDAPDTFGTLTSSFGPRHTDTGPTLGPSRDTDADGQPTPNGDGDDTDTGGDDEDGITFAGPIMAGALEASVTVNASSAASLDAWIDFNGDGTFAGGNEQIFTTQPVAAGDNNLTFIVPADARQGATFGRFRLSTAGGLGPRGFAPDGEVEDHVLSVENPSGTGQFADSGQNLGNHNSNGVSLGDVDGDGDLDAFVAGAFGSGNHVWLADGSGNFTDSGQSLGNHNSLGTTLGDVDGDGDLDAFVTNSSGQANRVWLNDGSGNFTDSGQDLGNRNSYGVSLGDLDGDGDLDAFVANNNQDNRVWLADGSGNFSDGGRSLGNHSSRSVALGDVDGDGDLDGFVSNGKTHGNRVWLGDGSGDFTDSGQSLGNYDSVRVAFGDLDGDGNLDAFVANFSFGDRVWLGDGSGNFSDSGQSLGDHQGYGVSLGDLDGDGDLDAFVAYLDHGNRAWLGDGSGNFSDSGQSLADHGSRSVSLGDLDGDGDLDAFVANLGQGNRVWLNQDPPKVVEVLVRGNGWSQSFLDHLASSSLGTDGYSIPVGSPSQLNALPWLNIDQVLIRFNEQVNLDLNDLTLTGVNVATYGLANLTTGVGVTGDFEAVWTLTAPVTTDKLRIRLDGTTGGAVTDTTGNVLDGEWIDTVSTYPSGDDVAGSDFAFRFNVLPADFDGDGTVTLNPDAQMLLAGNGSRIAMGSYSAFIDYNGDGTVTLNPDVQTGLSQLGTSLPSGTPSDPSPLGAETTRTIGAWTAAPSTSATTKPRATSSAVDRFGAIFARGHGIAHRTDSMRIASAPSTHEARFGYLMDGLRMTEGRPQKILDSDGLGSRNSYDLLAEARPLF